MKSTTIARIRQIRQSLFARFAGVQTSADHAPDRERKLSAVRQLFRIMNNDSNVWVPTQVVADRSSSVFARLRCGLSLRVSALTIRNPFSRDNLERTKRAFAFSFIETTLEKRQLLATFLYTDNNDGTGSLVITTDSADETISIISQSDIGNYTLTTNNGAGAFFTGDNVTPGLAGNTTDTLTVGSDIANLTQITISDGGANSGSSFYFGSSGAWNFVDDLTVSFSNTTSGTITVANATNFFSGADLSLTTNSNSITVSSPLSANGLSNISLTATTIALSNNITTTGTQVYTGNLIINGNVSLDSGGYDISVSGTINRQSPSSTNINYYTTGNTTWTVPAGVTQADVLVVGGGGGGGRGDVSGGGGGGQVVESSNLSVSGSVAIVVGAGGSSVANENNSGITGQSSSFGSTTALGGGGGSSKYAFGNTSGWTGGGGSSFRITGITGIGTIKGGDGARFVIGTTTTASNAGGGGGGAGGNGTSGGLFQGGGGGIGLQSNITGILNYYGGGGGGGSVTGGDGTDGGGAGGSSLAGVAGTPNTGGGGGGDGNGAGGGVGGSGYVIVKYVTYTSTTGYLSINAGAGAVNLSGSIGFTTMLDSLSIITGDLALPSISTSSLSVNSTGTITQTGPANVTGTAILVATGDITLGNTTNDFSTVTASGTNISVNDLNNITIGAITASGDFTVQGDSTTSCISVTGPIDTRSGSGNVSLTGRNIVVTGNISTAAGGITLLGNNGTYQTGDFDGVQINGLGVNVNTTGGRIVIDGRGGLNTVYAGVNLTDSTVQAGGVGCVTITGMSGNGSGGNAYGIFASGGTVTTNSGSITLNGTSCGTGYSSRGVFLDSSANISATGAGNVTITGTAACGTSDARGVFVNFSCVTSSTGSLTVNGTSNGNGTNSRGVYLYSSANISATGTGNVTISGSTPGNLTNGIGIDSTDPGDKVWSTGGLITLATNSINLIGTVNATSSGNVLIQTLGAGVDLGGTGDSTALGLTGTEIARITANKLTIGSSTTGDIAITDAITFGNLTLSSGGLIEETGAGNLTVPGAASFMTTGNAIALNNATNDFYSTGSISASGGNTTIVNSNATVLGQISVIELTVNSTGGNITQAAGSNIVVSNNGTFISNNTINLSNQTNSIGNLSVTSATAEVEVTGNQAVGSLNVANLVFTGTGSLTQDSGTSLVVTGTANFSVTGNITFDDPNNNFSGPIIVSGNTISIYNSGPSNLTSVDVQELRLTTANGDITGSTNVIVRGLHTTYLTATNGNIIMTNLTNDFVGGIYANASNIIEIYNSNSTVLGNISATSFNMTSAGGNITQVPGTDVIVSGTSNLVATGNAIILSEPTNNFGTVTASGTNITITDTNALTLGSIAGSGTVQITAQNVTITSTVDSTSSGSVLLIPTSGTVVDLGTKSTGNFGLTSTELGNITANVLTIGNSTSGDIFITSAIANGTNFANLTLITGGNITEPSGNLTITGTTNLVASGNVDLSNSTNDFGIITASGTNISVNDLNDITIGAITTSGDFTVQGDNTTSCITVTGPIDALGGSGNVSLTGRNIVVTGNISTAAGDITLLGNNGTYQTGAFDGVCISGAGVNVNTTGGNITIDGRAGGGSDNAGVKLDSSSVQAGGPGYVTITGVSGNGSGGGDYGFYATGATVTTSTGSLTVNGTSCGTGSYVRGVFLSSSEISATDAGNLTITGTAACGTDHACGIYMNATTVTTSNGSLTVNGTSFGTLGASMGVVILGASNVSATGSGNLTITGNSANGTDDAYTVLLADHSEVSTNSGSLTIIGTSSGTATRSRGVELVSVNISSTGAGNVTITGIAANGSDNACGIFINGSNVTTSTGSLTVNGTSCITGAGSMGVYTYSSSNISATGAGNVTITGRTPGNNTGVGISLRDSGDLVYSNAGLITLTANSLNLAGTVNATTAGNVLIQTLGAGVNLGGAGDATTLGLSSSDIGKITANVLIIGNGSTGDIVITDAITRSNPAIGTNLTLITGGSISELAGSLTITGTAEFNATGNITLDDAANDFDTIIASGTNVTITDTNALTLGSIAGNGTVQITAQSVTITSTVDATSSGSVLLIPTSGTVVDLGTKSTGNFGLTSTELGNITANVLTIGNSATGDIFITSAIANGTNFANLTLITGGSITEQSGNLSITGTTDLVATGNITLDDANDFSTILASGTDITINDTNAVILGSIVANGTVQITAQNVTITSNVTSTGTQQYNGSVILNQNATLTTTDNDIQFSGTLVGNSHNLDITIGTGNISFGNNVSGIGNITFNSSNQITATGSFGATNLILTNGTLNANTAFTTALKVDGGTANIQTAGSLTGNANVVSGSLISANLITGTLAINGGSANMQTGAVTTGLATLAAGNLTSNARLQALVVTTGTANLTGGTVANLTQSGGEVISVANITGFLTQTNGTTTINAGGIVGGNTTLSNNAILNSVGSLNGTLTANDHAVVTISGNVTGATLANNDANLTVTSTGTLASTLTLADRSVANVSGHVTGAAFITNSSNLTLSGNLGSTLLVNGSSRANVTGHVAGDTTQTNTSILNLTGTLAGALIMDSSAHAFVNGGGRITGLSTTSQGAQLTVNGTAIDTANLAQIGAVTVNGGNVTIGTFGNVTGAVLVANYGPGMYVSGNLQNTLAITGGQATIYSTATVAGTTTVNGGMITSNGSLGALNVQSGTVSLTGGTASNLTQSGGTVTSVANITGFANLSNGTTTILSDGKIEGTTTVTGSGCLTSNGSLHDLYAQSGSSVSINLTGGTVTGGLYQSVGTVSSIANITGVANLNGGTTAINNGGIIGGTTTVNNGSLTSNGVLSEGLLLNNGTASFNGGSVNRTGDNSAIVVNNGTLTAQNTTINGATGATANTPTVYISGGSVSLSNNTLTLGNSTRYLLFNNATASVSAIGNTWNGVNTATANLSQLYDTVDRIIDSVDVVSLGLVRIKDINVYVTKDSFYSPLGTTAADVQRGVNSASVNNIVRVKAGDYNVTNAPNNGVVTVSNNLTITGAGEVTTSVRAFVLNNGSDITSWSGISATSNVTIHSGAVISNATSTPTLVSLIDSNGSLIFDSGASFAAQLNVVNKNLTITSNTTANSTTINTIGSGSANTAISLSSSGNVTLTDLTLGGSGSALNATNTGSLTIDRLKLTAGLANLTTGVVGTIANTGPFIYNGQTDSTDYYFAPEGMSTNWFNSQFLSFSPNGNVTINSFAGNDIFFIDRNLLATTINGGAGDDIFAIGLGQLVLGVPDTSNTSSVTLMNGETGNNTLVGPVFRSNIFTLTGNGTGNLNTTPLSNFTGIQNIWGGSMNDTIVVNRGANITSIVGSLFGGSGIDTIQVDSNAGDTVDMTITGNNTGNISGTGGTSVGSYSGISNLIGTAGNDTFKFIDNASLITGTVNGGTGRNAFNYTGTTKPTFVNLATGQATGVTTTTNTGVATNIQDLFGGTGNDYFSGSSAANVMDGGSGNDTLLGLAGNDILVGNYGQDLINGGAGYDILIGGFIDFVSTIPNASLQTGLQTIMTSWITVTTDQLFTSVSNSLNTASSSQYRLVGDTNLSSTYLLQTVFNDQAKDNLIDIASSSVPNWFFATERVTQYNDTVQAGTTLTVSKKTLSSKTIRSPR